MAEDILRGKSYSPRQLTGLVLGLVLFFGMLLLPPFEGMSASAQRMAAIVLLMASWWITEAIPIPATSLLPIVLYPALGVMGTAQVTPNYGSQLVFLFLGGFMIASAVVKWDLHRRIALLTILFIGTSPRRLILGFMLACAFLSMWISNSATTMMMLPVGMAVVTKLSEGAELNGVGGEESEKLLRHSLGLSLMLGIAHAASIGGIGTLVGTPPNGVFVGQVALLYEGAAPEITFAKWMMIGVPVMLVMLPLIWLAVVYLSPKHPLKNFTIKLSGGEVIRKELKLLGPMSPGERKTAIIFALAAFLWIFRSPISLGFVTVPGWSQLFGPWGKLFTDSTVAICMGLLLFLIPSNIKDFSFKRTRAENFLLDWKTAQSSIPWGLLLLFGGGFALAQGFTTSGLSKFIGSRLQVLDGMEIFWVVLIVALLISFLTEVTSNTATATLIIPILAVLAIDLGQHPFLLMIPATISASCAFMLPVATPPNAIVFGSNWVTIPSMAKTGVLLNLAGAIVAAFVTIYIATAVFGIVFGELPPWTN